MIISRTLFVATLCCASVARGEIHPVVDMESRLLLGASAGQKWVKAQNAAKQFQAGTSFRVFELGKELGAANGLKVGPEMEVCPDEQVVSFAGEPDRNGIAVAASWNPLPRPVRLADTTQKVYRDAVREFL